MLEIYKFYILTKMLKYKTVVIGDINVGKSSLIYYLHYGKTLYTSDSTMGASYYTYKEYEIWDTAGQERYLPLLPLYSRNADVILAIYDRTDMGSYQNIKDKWIPYIKRSLNNEDIIICVIENKIDKLRQKDMGEEVKDYCKNNNMCYWQTSAFEGTGIVELFEHISEMLKDKPQKIKENINLTENIINKYSCSFPNNGC